MYIIVRCAAYLQEYMYFALGHLLFIPKIPASYLIIPYLGLVNRKSRDQYPKIEEDRVMCTRSLIHDN